MKCSGFVTYRLELSSGLSKIYDTFYIYVIQKYVFNLSHMLEFKPIELREDVTYEEKSLRILDIND